jgi:hypothetical protein
MQEKPTRAGYPDADPAGSSFPPQASHRPTAIEVRSTLRRVSLTTPLPDEAAWVMLLVPDGSTDAQVLEWAEHTLPPEAAAELRQILKREAGKDSTSP